MVAVLEAKYESYRKLLIAFGIVSILFFLIYIISNKQNEQIVLTSITSLIIIAIIIFSLRRKADCKRYLLSLNDLALSWFNFLKALFIIAVVLYGIENTNDPRTKDILNLILYISYIFIYLYSLNSMFIFIGQTMSLCTAGFASKSHRYVISRFIITIVITSAILVLIYLFLPEIVRSLPQGK